MPVNMKRKAISLDPKADASFKCLNCEELKVRSLKLQDVGECGYALLCIWVRIEAALKLLRYYDEIAKGWPNQLKLVNRNWGRLKQIVQENNISYEVILGNENSLRLIRNEVAHLGVNVDKEKALTYVRAGNFVLDRLHGQVPDRQRYVDKKRRSDAQLSKSSS